MDSLWVGLSVGAGGFLGSVLRYGVHRGVAELGGVQGFPYHTLVVNVIGCLAVGFVAALLDERDAFSPLVRGFLLVGVLGGFTTFSTFGHETHVLFRDGLGAPALLNVLLHVGLGLAAVWLGHALARATG